MTSRVGEQLELEFYAREPWGGRSPRGLTRAAQKFSLPHEGATRSIETPVVASMESAHSPCELNQLEAWLWPEL